MRRRRALGLTLIVGSQLLLLALVAAGGGQRTVALARTASGDRRRKLKQAQAIVILAGGNNRGSPEWGGETVKTYTLQRVRYGARLARETGLPILRHRRPPRRRTSWPRATLMREVLVQEYGLEVRWIDVTGR